MKRVMGVVIWASMLVGTLALVLRVANGFRVQAQEACTNERVRGAYGCFLGGTVLTGFEAMPYASTGRLVADGNGNFYGTETVSAGGNAFQNSYTGTYKVNPDCTGSATFRASTGTVSNFDFVIVNGGSEIEFIETDPGTVISGSARRQ